MAKGTKPIWDASKSVLRNARAVLPSLAAGYLQASQRITTRRAKPKALHKFRVQTRRFRFTLEMLRPCYGPGLDLRIDDLQHIQQQLGEINDCVTTRRLLNPREDDESGQLARVAKFLNTRIAEKTRNVVRQLQPSLRAPDQQRWWTEYLGRPGVSGHRKLAPRSSRLDRQVRPTKRTQRRGARGAVARGRARRFIKN